MFSGHIFSVKKCYILSPQASQDISDTGQKLSSRGNYKCKESLSFCLSVCPSIILTTVHSIDLTLGECVAEDPRKCSVECEVVWMSGSPEICKQQYCRPCNRPISNRLWDKLDHIGVRGERSGSCTVVQMFKLSPLSSQSFQLYL